MTYQTTGGRGSALRPDGEQVTLAAMLAPVVERWRLLAVLALVFAATAAAITLLRKPRYDASLYLATVTSGQSGLSLGGAAALLAGNAAAAQGGFQINPPLVANLLVSRRVLTEVATSTVPGTRTRVAEAVAGEPVDQAEAVRRMRRVVDADVSKETGLISLAVTSTDSALARVVAVRLVDATKRAYVETARAQATQLREAHQARVDSAGRRLNRAQEGLTAFLSANRVVAEYSGARVREDALQREVRLATEIFMKAAGDREAAVAKELEQTPVVVTVDPLPETLPQKPRFTALATALGAIAGLLVGLVVVFVGEGLRRDARGADPEYARLRDALDDLPFAQRPDAARRGELVG
jgi:uncharacterized protein involved in exopolysaccharide biosynthesis